MNSSGIYLIRNIVNGKKYVGSTSSSQGFRSRWRNHKKALRNNYHRNSYLQYSWNKYGEDNFKFIVLETCLDNFLTTREQYWINFHESNNRKFGYNLRDAGNHGTMSKESRKKMSEFRKLWSKNNQEIVKNTICNLAKINKGNKYCLGKKASLETKSKLRISNGGKNNGFYNKRHIEETKRKIRLSRIGSKATEETKKKMSFSRLCNTNCLGNKLSEEHKAKLRLSQLGRKASPETKQKMRDVWKIRKLSQS